MLAHTPPSLPLPLPTWPSCCSCMQVKYHIVPARSYTKSMLLDGQRLLTSWDQQELTIEVSGYVGVQNKHD